ncbi:hypothetical protein MHY86_08680 [Aerococcus urinaeequi]|uniref:hypothetical protein n=1 Tax=Aerococcus urinaeequi TaxID=51665 RepID=UPI00227E2D26|nr:hypothetical protein [Aerococcus urinaeequi]MCY7731773.1 hypothetical protein [Aerococcus urinaeequi]
MKREIIEFLEDDFKYRLQEWEMLHEQNDKDTYLKITHLEELFKTAVKYKFPQYKNTNEFVNSYLDYLENK